MSQPWPHFTSENLVSPLRGGGSAGQGCVVAPMKFDVGVQRGEGFLRVTPGASTRVSPTHEVMREDRF